MKLFFCFFLLLSLTGCVKESNHSTVLSSGVRLGEVDARLKEASGLVASFNNPGFLWTINDSGNSAEVFLIDQQARIRMTCRLANIQNRDWEDIAIGCSDSDGKHYLYIADIGDNFLQHDRKLIYRFQEPVLTDEKEKTINLFDTFIFRMPDGKRDAEAILFDPDTNDIFIISKHEDSVGLYRAPNPLSAQEMTFEKVRSLPLKQIVAGSISGDGQMVLLKSYGKIYYWRKSGQESLIELLATHPGELPYQREQQGEAIAWSNDASEFYTLSESTWRKPASLIAHRRKNWAERVK